MVKAGRVDQPREIVRLVERVLGDRVIGAYLHGSAVHGGLKPASDLDVLVVATERMSDESRRALVEGLFEISGAAVGLRPVELTVVAHDDIRPWRYPPVGDFLYGEWMRDDFADGGAPMPEPMPDLALVLAVTLAGDHALAGPPPAEVLDPVPAADVARASLAGIPGLLDDLPGDTRNVVLTLARIWTTLDTGEILAKDAAADWALARLSPRGRPVLAYARNLYLNHRYSEESWSDELRAGVRPCVDEMLAHIARLAAAIHGGEPGGGPTGPES